MNTYSNSYDTEKIRNSLCIVKEQYQVEYKDNRMNMVKSNNS
jgi:hypothetical protein